jgi:hypothetical protein
MSTRGSVAWRLPDGAVLGVYNHCDSYPTSLGTEVFAAARKLGIASLVAELLQYGDWRELESRGICRFCGKKAGQPHSMSALLFGYDSQGREAFVQMRAKQAGNDPHLKRVYADEMALLDAVVADRQRTGYPDPDARYHQHNNGAEEQFNPFLDPLFMEWVYVLDPVRNLIEVWASAEHDPVKLRGYRGSGRSVPCHRGPHYTHVLAAEVPLDSQPDWEAIEQVRDRVAA